MLNADNLSAVVVPFGVYSGVSTVVNVGASVDRSHMYSFGVPLAAIPTNIVFPSFTNDDETINVSVTEPVGLSSFLTNVIDPTPVLDHGVSVRY